MNSSSSQGKSQHILGAIDNGRLPDPCRLCNLDGFILVRLLLLLRRRRWCLFIRLKFLRIRSLGHHFRCPGAPPNPHVLKWFLRFWHGSSTSRNWSFQLQASSDTYCCCSSELQLALTATSSFLLWDGLGILSVCLSFCLSVSLCVSLSHIDAYKTDLGIQNRSVINNNWCNCCSSNSSEIFKGFFFFFIIIINLSLELPPILDLQQQALEEIDYYAGGRKSSSQSSVSSLLRESKRQTHERTVPHRRRWCLESENYCYQISKRYLLSLWNSSNLNIAVLKLNTRLMNELEMSQLQIYKELSTQKVSTAWIFPLYFQLP